MGHDLDEVEREVVQLLREKGPLRFTDIVQSLSAASRATPPKLSRRLKRLVDLGVVRREVTNDWPPRALYLVNIGAGQTGHAQTVKGTASEPNASSKPRADILTRSVGTLLAVLGLAFVILALSSILLPGIGGILVLILVGACLVWIGLGFDTQAPGSERYLAPIRGWATGQAAKGRFTVCGFIAAGISAAHMVVGIANRLLMPATHPHPAFHIATFTFQVYPVLLVIAGSALLGRFVDLYFRRERRGAGIILLGAFAVAFLLVVGWTFVFLVSPITGTLGLLVTVVFWVSWVGVYLLFSFSERSAAGAKVQLDETFPGWGVRDHPRLRRPSS